jgi:hypothetical protein
MVMGGFFGDGGNAGTVGGKIRFQNLLLTSKPIMKN